MELHFIPEYQMPEKYRMAIANLLATVFPYAHYEGRSYFKQMPHFRILMEDQDKIVGHLGIDYRVMNLDGKLISVWGMIDLAVDPGFRNQGIASRLVKCFEQNAIKNKHNIDFMYLVTDIPEFYLRHGFTPIKPEITWLKIHQGTCLEVGCEQVDEATIMMKPVSGVPWKGNRLDLLGYWY